uniref:Uncharacterized protein n=1 Tax=Globodera rostochiensis TaxID=31243 RepID=A0A914I4C2_GLORO
MIKRVFLIIALCCLFVVMRTVEQALIEVHRADERFGVSADDMLAHCQQCCRRHWPPAVREEKRRRQFK